MLAQNFKVAIEEAQLTSRNNLKIHPILLHEASIKPTIPQDVINFFHNYY